MEVRLEPSPDGNQLTAYAEFLLVRDLLEELSDLSEAQAVVTEIGPDSSTVSASRLNSRFARLHSDLLRSRRQRPD